MKIVGKHCLNKNILDFFDNKTKNGIEHRVLIEKENDVFREYMKEIIPKYHENEQKIERTKKDLKELKIKNINRDISIYPKSDKTKKGNFAEIFLNEYLQETTKTKSFIYRLRYNPNKEQSMKGDDVLLFDLNSNPVKIIVGESKFRKIPDKSCIKEIENGLKKSKLNGLPISLEFISDMLLNENNTELSDKLLDCRIMDEKSLKIGYIGFLMSNKKAKDCVNKNVCENFENFEMISMNLETPDEIVSEIFEELEDDLYE